MSACTYLGVVSARRSCSAPPQGPEIVWPARSIVMRSLVTTRQVPQLVRSLGQNVGFTGGAECPARIDPCGCARAGHAGHRAERRECCQRKTSQQSLGPRVVLRVLPSPCRRRRSARCGSPQVRGNAAVGECFLNQDTKDGLGHMGSRGSQARHARFTGVSAPGRQPERPGAGIRIVRLSTLERLVDLSPLDLGRSGETVRASPGAGARRDFVGCRISVAHYAAVVYASLLEAQLLVRRGPRIRVDQQERRLGHVHPTADPRGCRTDSAPPGARDAIRP